MAAEGAATAPAPPGEGKGSGAPSTPRAWAAWLGRILGLLGFGGAEAYLIREGRWREAGAAALVAFLVFMLKPIARFTRRFFERAGQRMEEKADALADRAVDGLSRWLQTAWDAVFARHRRNYCKHLEFRLRTYRTQGLKTRGAFKPDLEKVYVPLRISPSSPTKVSPDLVGRGSGRAARQIWDFLADTSERAYRHMAVLARPGAGKTTLLEHLTLAFARNTERRFDRRAPRLLPILLYLRDIRARVTEKAPPSLAAVVAERLKAEAGSSRDAMPPEGWFEDRLAAEKSSCLVMLDGLDEVADAAEREAMSRWVDAQMQRYPQARFMLTSRPHGYLTAPPEHIETVVEVEPFSRDDTRRFVESWYLENERMSQQRRLDAGVRMEAERRTRALMAEIERSPVLSDLCVNPLLLTMITTVHDNQGALPENRVGLYKEICEVLLVRRQREKGLEDPLSALKKQALLQKLSLELMRAKRRGFTLADAERWLAKPLAEVAGDALTTERFIELVAQQSGLLVEREAGEHELCHKSLQEYLAATEVKETGEEQLLIDHFAEPWWEETTRLYAAQSDTGNLIREALANPTVATLTLAFDCLKEGLKTPPELRARLEETVEAGLESYNREYARLAAEVVLERRLRSMVRIDERTDVDLELVSNAEYRLFADSLAVASDPDYAVAAEILERWPFAPGHVAARTLPPGQARAPATGVSPEAVLAFCRWLERRNPKKDLLRFRLPRIEEIGAAGSGGVSGVSSALGFWCQTADGFELVGLSSEHWRRYLEELGLDATKHEAVHNPSSIPSLSQLTTTALMLKAFAPSGVLDAGVGFLRAIADGGMRADWTELVGALALFRVLGESLWRLDLTRALDIARALGVNLDLARVLTRVPPLDVAPSRDLDRARALDVARARTRALNAARALDVALDFDRALLANHTLFLESPRVDFERALDLTLDRAIDRALDPASTLNIDTGLALAHLFDISRKFPKTPPAQTVTAPVLAAALRASLEHARYWSAVFGRTQTIDLVRDRWKLSKADVEALQRHYTEHARTVGELWAWADLYARRLERGHPGWEGLRIVRETRKPREQETASVDTSPNPRGATA